MASNRWNSRPEYCVLAWEYEEQPDWSQVAQAITRFHPAIFTIVESEDDTHGLVISRHVLSKDEVLAAYLNLVEDRPS